MGGCSKLCDSVYFTYNSFLLIIAELQSRKPEEEGPVETTQDKVSMHWSKRADNEAATAHGPVVWCVFCCVMYLIQLL